VIQRVVKDVEEHGRIRHSFLGVVVGDGKKGAAIASVLDGSPAAAAGLRKGERITAVDGEPCTSGADLSRALVLRRPGEEVSLTVASPPRTVTATLTERAEASKRVASPSSTGLSCVELGPDLRVFLKLDGETNGVVVLDVRADSAAGKAGLRRGDLITKAGGNTVANLEELRAALAPAKGKITIEGLRDGAAFACTVAVSAPRSKRRAR
jgi:serine protease Do